jgi:hypothetical protein
VRIGQTAGPQSARFQIYDASSQQLVLKATDAASNYAGAQISFGNATNQAFISNVSSNELFISAFDSLALGSNRIAIGPSSQAVGLQSMAFGTFSTAQSDSGMAIGHIVQSSATSGFVIGKGIDGPIVNTPLENDSPNTIVMGMNTDTASLFIDKGTGPGQPGNVGIQTESPKADLDVQGSYRTKVTTITSDYTVQPDDYSIFVDNGTPSDFNVTLPDPTLQRNKGRVLIIRCYGTKGAFLDPQGSGTEIEGNSGYTVSNGEAATIQCNGTEWYVISEATP